MHGDDVVPAIGGIIDIDRFMKGMARIFDQGMLWGILPGKPHIGRIKLHLGPVLNLFDFTAGAPPAVCGQEY